MKKDYTDLSALSDKKLRTLRNNLNNRLESFKRGGEKNLPPSHMLYQLDEDECKSLLLKIQEEIRLRAKR
ncbi:MAG: hypothetical protein ACLGHN_04660 [Bacteriovoracia bacterium]